MLQQAEHLVPAGEAAQMSVDIAPHTSNKTIMKTLETLAPRTCPGHRGLVAVDESRVPRDTSAVP
jgi:hypothetical protein